MPKIGTRRGSRMIKAKEKPITFNTELIPAILNLKPDVWPPEPIDPGKPWKYMTRRVIKPQPLDENRFEGPYWYEPAVINKEGEIEPGKPVFGISAIDGEWGIKCPYPPGTRLWVKETWRSRWRLFLH